MRCVFSGVRFFGLVWLLLRLAGVAVVVGVWLVFGVGVAGALSTGPLPESTGTRPAGVAVPWPGGRGWAAVIWPARS